MAGEELIPGETQDLSLPSGQEEKIKVLVRLRPLNDKEIARHDVSDWECINNNTIIFKNTLPERSMFPAAYAFGELILLCSFHSIFLLFGSLQFSHCSTSLLLYRIQNIGNLFSNTCVLIWFVFLARDHQGLGFNNQNSHVFYLHFGKLVFLWLPTVLETSFPLLMLNAFCCNFGSEILRFWVMKLENFETKG